MNSYCGILTLFVYFCHGKIGKLKRLKCLIKRKCPTVVESVLTIWLHTFHMMVARFTIWSAFGMFIAWGTIISWPSLIGWCTTRPVHILSFVSSRIVVVVLCSCSLSTLLMFGVMIPLASPALWRAVIDKFVWVFYRFTEKCQHLIPVVDGLVYEIADSRALLVYVTVNDERIWYSI